jgi:voltage-gated sodium channel
MCDVLSIDDNTRRIEVSSGHFILFDDKKTDPFIFDDDAFGMYDSYGVHHRQYSTASVSTNDGITVLRGAPSFTNHSNDGIMGWCSKWTGRFLNNLFFKRILLALIISYSVLAGLSTTAYVSENEELSRSFLVFRRGFLYIFTFELLLRVIRYRFKIYTSGWLLFDLSIIGGSWFLLPLLVLRTFRVMRSLRHATRFHLLRDVIMALRRCFPKVIAILYFLILIIYVFAVIFTSSFKYQFEEFRRLDVTMLTLFQIMTLDGWSDIARSVIEEYAWAWALFCSFVTISSLILINFFVAIMIQGITSLPKSRDEETFQLESLEIGRLEAKVDQLICVLEAFRNSQNKVGDVASSLKSSITTETTILGFSECNTYIESLNIKQQEDSK